MCFIWGIQAQTFDVFRWHNPHARISNIQQLCKQAFWRCFNGTKVFTHYLTIKIVFVPCTLLSRLYEWHLRHLNAIYRVKCLYTIILSPAILVPNVRIINTHSISDILACQRWGWAIKESYAKSEPTVFYHKVQC